MRLTWFARCGVLVLSASGWAQAAPAHEHGVARLDVAVEAQRILIELDSPLDNLLGFERAPRTDAERARVEAMLKRLRDGASLFKIDPQAGCSLDKVELRSAPLKLGGASPPAAGEHGDLEGSWEFRCSAGARARFVDVSLFEPFAPLKRIELQLATPKGQMQATLRRPATRVQLAR